MTKTFKHDDIVGYDDQIAFKEWLSEKFLQDMPQELNFYFDDSALVDGRSNKTICDNALDGATVDEILSLLYQHGLISPVTH